ncbi:MAG: hypothetical protein ONB44_02195 [candidate division KSB1 bacterium]|nr:hypothetical protein [candidate division KSB1 bacterium]MDZ7300934.1 hypothetical protein [candidate division KSB1 bacterium]MDZ7310387.1 hypothetical protein [candidate division KSB1 bacterium]
MVSFEKEKYPKKFSNGWKHSTYDDLVSVGVMVFDKEASGLGYDFYARVYVVSSNFTPKGFYKFYHCKRAFPLAS